MTHILAQMKEKDGEIFEAANILQELQVETYGSMEKREKVCLHRFCCGILLYIYPLLGRTHPWTNEIMFGQKRLYSHTNHFQESQC